MKRCMTFDETEREKKGVKLLTAEPQRNVAVRYSGLNSGIKIFSGGGGAGAGGGRRPTVARSRPSSSYPIIVNGKSS